MPLLDYSLCPALLWYSSVHNTNVSERTCGEKVFLIWPWQYFNSALIVQQVIMLLFDRKISSEICDIKDAAYIMSHSGLVNKKLNYCRETARRAMLVSSCYA